MSAVAWPEATCMRCGAEIPWEQTVHRCADGDTLTAPARPELDDGDHDRFAHYVRNAELTRALITGEHLTALCGKRWIPCRDPERFPVCPTCKERFAAGWRLGPDERPTEPTPPL